MPFSSDEQRKAVFAKLRGQSRGQSARPSGYRAGQGHLDYHAKPKRTKKPKTPKPPKANKPKSGNGNVAQSGDGWWVDIHNVYHAGNAPETYTSPYGSWHSTGQYNQTNTGMTITPGVSFGTNGVIPANSFDLIWDNPNTRPYVNRDLTTTEKVIGVGIAAYMAGAATGIFALAELSEAANALSVAGTQGGALGYVGLSTAGLNMQINDSQRRHIYNGIHVYSEEVDLVNYLMSKFK